MKDIHEEFFPVIADIIQNSSDFLTRDDIAERMMMHTLGERLLAREPRVGRRWLRAYNEVDWFSAQWSRANAVGFPYRSRFERRKGVDKTYEYRRAAT